MHINRRSGRLHGRQPIVVVLGMKGLDMANLRHATCDIKAMLASPHRIVIGHRPPIRPWHQTHPVRAQHMQFNRQTGIRANSLQITIARKQKLAIKRFKQLGPPLCRIGPPNQV